MAHLSSNERKERATSGVYVCEYTQRRLRYRLQGGHRSSMSAAESRWVQCPHLIQLQLALTHVLIHNAADP